MKKNNWTVLLVGGSSGIGKTRLTESLSEVYKAKIVEADDICCAVKSMTTALAYPAIHYWYGDSDWTFLSVEDNVDYLSKVSEELSPGLKAIVESHIRDESTVILEGDFISAKFAASFKDAAVKSIYIHEEDELQIRQNYLHREGGLVQEFRASISALYGSRLKEECAKYGLTIVQARPWETLVNRVIACIDEEVIK